MSAYKIAIIALFFFCASSAQALVQVRAHAGFKIFNPDDYNRWLSSQDTTQMYLISSTGFGAYLEPLPGAKLGLGIFYENQDIKVGSANGGSQDSKLSLQKTAAALYYHIVKKEVFYTGPALRVGFQHKSRVKGEGNIGVYDYEGSKGTSIYGGWDLGFKLGALLLGGEIGIQSERYQTNGPFELNPSGMSFMAYAGLGYW